MKLETTFLISLVLQKHNLSSCQFSGISYSHFPAEFQADLVLCMFLNVPFYFLTKKQLGKSKMKIQAFFNVIWHLELLLVFPFSPYKMFNCIAVQNKTSLMSGSVNSSNCFFMNRSLK